MGARITQLLSQPQPSTPTVFETMLLRHSNPKNKSETSIESDAKRARTWMNIQPDGSGDMDIHGVWDSMAAVEEYVDKMGTGTSWT